MLVKKLKSRELFFRSVVAPSLFGGYEEALVLINKITIDCLKRNCHCITYVARVDKYSKICNWVDTEYAIIRFPIDNLYNNLVDKFINIYLNFNPRIYRIQKINVDGVNY